MAAEAGVEEAILEEKLQHQSGDLGYVQNPSSFIEKEVIDSKEHQNPISVVFDCSQTIGPSQTYGAEAATGEGITIDEKAKNENLHSIAIGRLDKSEGEVFVEAPSRDQIPFSNDADVDLHGNNSVERKKEDLESAILVKKERENEVQERKEESATENNLSLSEKMHEIEKMESPEAEQVQNHGTLEDQIENREQESAVAMTSPEKIDTREITENEEVARKEESANENNLSLSEKMHEIEKMESPEAEQVQNHGTLEDQIENREQESAVAMTSPEKIDTREITENEEVARKEESATENNLSLSEKMHEIEKMESPEAEQVQNHGTLEDQIENREQESAVAMTSPEKIDTREITENEEVARKEESATENNLSLSEKMHEIEKMESPEAEQVQNHGTLEDQIENREQESAVAMTSPEKFDRREITENEEVARKEESATENNLSLSEKMHEIEKMESPEAEQVQNHGTLEDQIENREQESAVAMTSPEKIDTREITENEEVARKEGKIEHSLDKKLEESCKVPESENVRQDVPRPVSVNELHSSTADDKTVQDQEITHTSNEKETVIQKEDENDARNFNASPYSHLRNQIESITEERKAEELQETSEVVQNKDQLQERGISQEEMEPHRVNSDMQLSQAQNEEVDEQDEAKITQTNQNESHDMEVSLGLLGQNFIHEMKEKIRDMEMIAYGGETNEAEAIMTDEAEARMNVDEEQKRTEEHNEFNEMKQEKQTFEDNMQIDTCHGTLTKHSPDNVLEDDKCQEKFEISNNEIPEKIIMSKIGVSIEEAAAEPPEKTQVPQEEGEEVVTAEETIARIITEDPSSIPHCEDEKVPEMVNAYYNTETSQEDNLKKDAKDTPTNDTPNLHKVYDPAVRKLEETPSCVAEELIQQTTTTKDNVDIQMYKESTEPENLAVISNSMNKDQNGKSEELRFDNSRKDDKPQDEGGIEKTAGDIPVTVCKKQEDSNSVAEEQNNQTKDFDDNKKDDVNREKMESENLEIAPDLVHEEKMQQSVNELEAEGTHNFTNDVNHNDMASQIHVVFHDNETAKAKNDSILDNKMDENFNKYELVMDNLIEKNEQPLNSDRKTDTLQVSREILEETLHIINEKHEDDKHEVCRNMDLIEQDPISETVEEICRMSSGEQIHEVIADKNIMNFANSQGIVYMNKEVGSSSFTQNPLEENTLGAAILEESDKNIYDETSVEVALEDTHETKEANKRIEGFVSTDELAYKVRGVTYGEEQKEGEELNKKDELKGGEETIKEISSAISPPNTMDEYLDHVHQNDKSEKEHENTEAEVLETTILAEINSSTRELVEEKDLPNQQEESFEEKAKIWTPQEEALVGSNIAKASDSRENEDAKEPTRDNDKDMNKSISDVPDTDDLVGQHIQAVNNNQEIVLDFKCKEKIEEATHTKESTVADNIEEACQKLESISELVHQSKTPEGTSEVMMSQNSKNDANLSADIIDASEITENKEFAKMEQPQVSQGNVDILANTEASIIQKDQMISKYDEGICSMQHKEDSLPSEDGIQNTNMDKGEDEKDTIEVSYEEENLGGDCHVAGSVNTRDNIPRAVSVDESHPTPTTEDKTFQDQEITDTDDKKKNVIWTEDESEDNNFDAFYKQLPRQEDSGVEEENHENLELTFELEKNKDQGQETLDVLDEMGLQSVESDMQIFNTQNEEVNDQDEADDNHMQMNQTECHDVEVSSEVIVHEVVLEDKTDEAEARMNLDEENKKYNQDNELIQGKEASEDNMQVNACDGAPINQTLNDTLEIDKCKENIEISSIEITEKTIEYEIYASIEEDAAAAEKEHSVKSKLPQEESEAVLTTEKAVARISIEDPGSIPDNEDEKVSDVIHVNIDKEPTRDNDKDKNNSISDEPDTDDLVGQHIQAVNNNQEIVLDFECKEQIEEASHTKESTVADNNIEEACQKLESISELVHQSKTPEGTSEVMMSQNSKNDANLSADIIDASEITENKEFAKMEQPQVSQGNVDILANTEASIIQDQMISKYDEGICSMQHKEDSLPSEDGIQNTNMDKGEDEKDTIEVSHEEENLGGDCHVAGSVNTRDNIPRAVSVDESHPTPTAEYKTFQDQEITDTEDKKKNVIWTEDESEDSNFDAFYAQLPRQEDSRVEEENHENLEVTFELEKNKDQGQETLDVLDDMGLHSVESDMQIFNTQNEEVNDQDEADDNHMQMNQTECHDVEVSSEVIVHEVVLEDKTDEAEARTNLDEENQKYNQDNELIQGKEASEDNMQVNACDGAPINQTLNDTLEIDKCKENIEISSIEITEKTIEYEIYASIEEDAAAAEKEHSVKSKLPQEESEAVLTTEKAVARISIEDPGSTPDNEDEKNPEILNSYNTETAKEVHLKKSLEDNPTNNVPTLEKVYDPVVREPEGTPCCVAEELAYQSTTTKDNMDIQMYQDTTMAEKIAIISNSTSENQNGKSEETSFDNSRKDDKPQDEEGLEKNIGEVPETWITNDEILNNMASEIHVVNNDQETATAIQEDSISYVANEQINQTTDTDDNKKDEAHKERVEYEKIELTTDMAHENQMQQSESDDNLNNMEASEIHDANNDQETATAKNDSILEDKMNENYSKHELIMDCFIEKNEQALISGNNADTSPVPRKMIEETLQITNEMHEDNKDELCKVMEPVEQDPISENGEEICRTFLGEHNHEAIADTENLNFVDLKDTVNLNEIVGSSSAQDPLEENSWRASRQEESDENIYEKGILDGDLKDAHETTEATIRVENIISTNEQKNKVTVGIISNEEQKAGEEFNKENVLKQGEEIIKEDMVSVIALPNFTEKSLDNPLEDDKSNKEHENIKADVLEVTILAEVNAFAGELVEGKDLSEEQGENFQKKAEIPREEAPAGTSIAEASRDTNNEDAKEASEINDVNNDQETATAKNDSILEDKMDENSSKHELIMDCFIEKNEQALISGNNVDTSPVPSKMIEETLQITNEMHEDNKDELCKFMEPVEQDPISENGEEICRTFLGEHNHEAIADTENLNFVDLKDTVNVSEIVGTSSAQDLLEENSWRASRQEESEENIYYKGIPDVDLNDAHETTEDNKRVEDIISTNEQKNMATVGISSNEEQKVGEEFNKENELKQGEEIIKEDMVSAISLSNFTEKSLDNPLEDDKSNKEHENITADVLEATILAEVNAFAGELVEGKDLSEEQGEKLQKKTEIPQEEAPAGTSIAEASSDTKNEDAKISDAVHVNDHKEPTRENDEDMNNSISDVPDTDQLVGLYIQGANNNQEIVLDSECKDSTVEESCQKLESISEVVHQSITHKGTSELIMSENSENHANLSPEIVDASEIIENKESRIEQPQVSQGNIDILADTEAPIIQKDQVMTKYEEGTCSMPHEENSLPTEGDIQDSNLDKGEDEKDTIEVLHEKENLEGDCQVAESVNTRDNIPRAVSVDESHPVPTAEDKTFQDQEITHTENKKENAIQKVEKSDVSNSDASYYLQLPKQEDSTTEERNSEKLQEIFELVPKTDQFQEKVALNEMELHTVKSDVQIFHTQNEEVNDQDKADDKYTQKNQNQNEETENNRSKIMIALEDETDEAGARMNLDEEKKKHNEDNELKQEKQASEENMQMKTCDETPTDQTLDDVQEKEVCKATVEVSSIEIPDKILKYEIGTSILEVAAAAEKEHSEKSELRQVDEAVLTSEREVTRTNTEDPSSIPDFEDEKVPEMASIYHDNETTKVMDGGNLEQNVEAAPTSDIPVLQSIHDQVAKETEETLNCVAEELIHQTTTTQDNIDIDTYKGSTEAEKLFISNSVKEECNYKSEEIDLDNLRKDDTTQVYEIHDRENDQETAKAKDDNILENNMEDDSNKYEMVMDSLIQKNEQAANLDKNIGTSLMPKKFIEETVQIRNEMHEDGNDSVSENMDLIEQHLVSRSVEELYKAFSGEQNHEAIADTEITDVVNSLDNVNMDRIVGSLYSTQTPLEKTTGKASSPQESLDADLEDKHEKVEANKGMECVVSNDEQTNKLMVEGTSIEEQKEGEEINKKNELNQQEDSLMMVEGTSIEEQKEGEELNKKNELNQQEETIKEDMDSEIFLENTTEQFPQNVIKNDTAEVLDTTISAEVNASTRELTEQKDPPKEQEKSLQEKAGVCTPQEEAQVGIGVAHLSDNPDKKDEKDCRMTQKMEFQATESELTATSQHVVRKTTKDQEAVKDIDEKVELQHAIFKHTESSAHGKLETTTETGLVEVEPSCDENISDAREDSLCTMEASDMNTIQINIAEVTSEAHKNVSREDNETKETALLENENRKEQEVDKCLLSNKTKNEEEERNYLNPPEVKVSGKIYTNECIEDRTQEKKIKESGSQVESMKDVETENVLNIFYAMDEINKENKSVMDAENNEDQEYETRLESEEDEDKEEDNIQPDMKVYEAATTSEYNEENIKEKTTVKSVSENQKLEDVEAKNPIYMVPDELEIADKDTCTDEERQGEQLNRADLEEKFEKNKDRARKAVEEVGPFSSNEQIHACDATDNLSPQEQITKIVDSDMTIEDNHRKMVDDPCITAEFHEEMKNVAKFLPQMETLDFKSLKETETSENFVSQDVRGSGQNEISDLNFQDYPRKVMKLQQQSDEEVDRLKIEYPNVENENIIADDNTVPEPEVSGVKDAASEHIKENNDESNDMEPKDMLEAKRSVTIPQQSQKKMINNSDNISSDQGPIIMDPSEKRGTTTLIDEEERNGSFVIIETDGEVIKYGDKDLDEVSEFFIRESAEGNIETQAMHVEAANGVGINETGEKCHDETSISLLPSEAIVTRDQDDRVNLEETLKSESDVSIAEKDDHSVEFRENKELLGNLSTTQATETSILEDEKDRLEEAEGPSCEVAGLNRSKSEEYELIDHDDLPVSHLMEGILQGKRAKLGGVEAEAKVEENISVQNYDTSIPKQDSILVSRSTEHVREDTSTMEDKVGKFEDSSGLMLECSHDNVIGNNTKELIVTEDERPERNTNDDSPASKVGGNVYEDFSKADSLHHDEKIQTSIIGKTSGIPMHEDRENKMDIFSKEGGIEDMRIFKGVEKIDQDSNALLHEQLAFTSEPDEDAKILDKGEQSQLNLQTDEIGKYDSLIIDNTIEGTKIQSKGVKIESSRENQDAINELRIQNVKSDLNEQYMSFDSHEVQKLDTFVKSTDKVVQEEKFKEEISPKVLMDERQTNKTTDTHLDDDKTDEENDEKEDEDDHKIMESSHDSAVPVEARDAVLKPAHKKSHNILSGVGSKVKRSIAKVKKVITGKSSHSKTLPPP
ncbi:uncharacterized protein LOC135632156 isoform X3 [Musa acuminata AAA Group]|uniref:uncharacterized protein LOC135632156 isoform X3 n=1 Tax=Musa acuminata AAA Group TaxID=214697 RepID=UPI0031D547F8